MCVACHESLAVAQSPEAYSERQYIRTLIAQGLTTTHIVPPALVAIGIAVLVITMPRWRRRTRDAAAGQAAATPPPDPAEARRLDEDMARQI
jgi:hypothetical protein